MTTTHTERAHARLSPSSAHRWFACAGSPNAESPYPDSSSIFADHGTAAHELAEACLRGGFDASDFAGGYVDIKTGQVERSTRYTTSDYMPSSVFVIDDEMVEGVQLYLDTCESLTIKGDEKEIECKLDLRHIPGMEFGTGDFLRYRPSTKELVIVDLKYGKGVPVEVEENEQLLTYAEGTAKRFHNRGLTKVTMVIVQPRCPHPKGPVRVWTIDALDLAEFRFKLVAAAERTKEAEDQYGYALVGPGIDVWNAQYLVPGDHCKFCKAAAVCPALIKFSMAVAEMEFSDEPTKVSDMTPDQKGKVLRKASILKDFVKRVEESGHADALAGNPPTGFKLVHSTSHRKFKDEVSVGYLTDVLGIPVDDLMTEPKLRSPAQVEGILGKKRKGEIAALVYKPRGKIILAPASDPRESVKPGASEEFA